MTVLFTPTPDTATVLHALLDIFERRDGAPKQAIRVRLNDLKLPGYYSQIDPTPRITTNEQLVQLARHDTIALAWEQGQTSHLLETVTLNPAYVEPLYRLLARQPLAEQRQRLRELLLADRSRLTGWRRKAVEHSLSQLRDHRSPAPFSLTVAEFNQDLLTTLLHLPDGETTSELPYRVFSVRIFNDSKKFESFKETVARLARRHNPLWRDLSPLEVLRELGLVANPSHLYLYGPWRLIDAEGQVISLGEFYPSVGLPAVLAAQVRQVEVDADRVVCVENATTFYELVRHESKGLAAFCLAGNPSPAARHLLRCLAATLPKPVPLLLWADLDYGGLNILAQLRRAVSAHFRPFRMDIATLESHAQWAQPLTPNDERNLTRLRQHADLADLAALIDWMLLAGLKLEQEAVVLI